MLNDFEKNVVFIIKTFYKNLNVQEKTQDQSLHFPGKEHKNNCSCVSSGSLAPAHMMLTDIEGDKFNTKAGDEDTLLTTCSDVC